jgi:hypothetical protein
MLKFVGSGLYYEKKASNFLVLPKHIREVFCDLKIKGEKCFLNIDISSQKSQCDTETTFPY